MCEMPSAHHWKPRFFFLFSNVIAAKERTPGDHFVSLVARIVSWRFMKCIVNSVRRFYPTISSTVVHFMFGKKFFEDVIPWRQNKSLEPFSGGQEFL